MRAECAELMLNGGDGLRKNCGKAAIHFEAAAQLAEKALKPKLAGRYCDAAKEARVRHEFCGQAFVEICLLFHMFWSMSKVGELNCTF